MRMLVHAAGKLQGFNRCRSGNLPMRGALSTSLIQQQPQQTALVSMIQGVNNEESPDSINPCAAIDLTLRGGDLLRCLLILRSNVTKTRDFTALGRFQDAIS
jgi:hypothetical protein